MILYEPKENMTVVFTKSKDADLMNVINELGYAKKNGEPYKYVNIQKGGYVKLDGAPETLPATHLTAKGKDVYIVDDKVTLKVTRHNSGKFTSVLNTFGKNTSVRVDNRNFKGGFRKSGDGAIKDENGTVISIGGAATETDNKQLNTFVYKMRQDNGRLLAPIMQKYITALHFVGRNRSMVTGYAHLPTYLQLIKSPFGDLAKSLRENKGESDGGLVYGAGKDSFMVDIVVRGAKGRILMLDVNSKVGLSSTSGDDKTPNPYVLFSTKPIRFTDEEVPRFTVSMGRQTIFITIFMFEAEKYLQDLKGGTNLLKMW
jgi:hypothetical protein